MVKFGGHVEAVREGDLVNADLYLIPYNKIKLLIREHKKHQILDGNNLGAEQKEAEGKPDEEELFINSWNNALKDAEQDFQKARTAVWQMIFATITADDDTADPLARGAHPGNAIKLFVDVSHSKGGSEAHELLVRMGQIYRAASINSESLRKLVKKFDKHQQERQLCSKLLPFLYASSLYSGRNMIKDSIDLLRELIIGEYDDNDADTDDDSLFRDPNDRPTRTMIRQNSEIRHKESVEVRMMELNWLQSLVRSISSKEMLPKLVAHRGFHSTKDRNDKRPVENSLSAYETAWTCGIEMCECDIALTKDEKLILAHDDDFGRLSLDTQAANSKRKVGDLTFKQIISMPLSNGARPPLLIDVLRSASAISDKSKLIIEIKPGNESSAFALARLLIRHPNLRSSVAMIMSFDAATMHQLRAELKRAIPSYTDQDVGMPLQVNRRLTSYDHFGTMESQWLGNFGASSAKLPSFASSRNINLSRGHNMSSIGLSISETNLNNAPATNTIKEEFGPLEEYDQPQSFSAPLEQHKRTPPSNSMPKLMLLTVADKPDKPHELQVQYNELHRVDDWLGQEGDLLDGVYLQFEKEMMTPEGAACLRQLSQRCLIGIWQYAERDPDDFETFEWLVNQGNCSFVNTDLPKHFRQEDLLNETNSLPPRP